MNNKGWVKYHRNLSDHPCLQSKLPMTEKEAFVELLACVNFKDTETKVCGFKVTCKRGQSFNSYRTWGAIFRWSHTKVKRFFEELRDNGDIKIEYFFVDRNGLSNELKSETSNAHKNTKSSLCITVCNYEDYKGGNFRTEDFESYRTLLTKDNNNRLLTKVNNCHLSDDKVTNNNSKKLPHEDNTFHKVKEVMEYLNLKTCRDGRRKLRPESKSSKYIRARFKDGYDVGILKLVVDLKCNDWLGDKKMEKYLKPDTLFNAEKFEKYLDELLESDLMKVSAANLSFGDLLTNEILDEFEDDDVMIVDSKSFDEDVSPNRTGARMTVKSIKGGIKLKRGEYFFVEMVN